MEPLENIRPLIAELRERGWVLTVFNFTYKSKKYFVFVERYLPGEARPKFAAAKIRFARASNLADILDCWANSGGLHGKEAQELRTYFDIDFAKNLGDIFTQLAQQLNQAIPHPLPPELSPELKSLAVTRLSDSETEDPAKIYCTGVRRNPQRADGTPGQRSAFNEQKTMLLRPELHRHFAREVNVSFVYSDEAEAEKTDEQVLDAFARLTQR